MRQCKLETKLLAFVQIPTNNTDVFLKIFV